MSVCHEAAAGRGLVRHRFNGMEVYVKKLFLDIGLQQKYYKMGTRRHLCC